MEKYPLNVNIPENAGVPSDKILNFINHIEQQKLCIHSFMLIRHGEILAEGYYPPFKSDTLHRMYSTSKTFVAIAVGLLIDEGKLSLTDKIIDFFPEYCPDNIHPYVADMNIRDLLMMATPFSYNTYTRGDKNWVWTFLNAEPSHPAGTLYSYDTSGTVMLNGIVEKVSGMELMDYMRPKIFDHIGISESAHAIQRPEGGAWGGSGVLCSTHDLAKFALLLLNKGRHNGKQLISESYITEATSAQIDNQLSSSNPEFHYGYGYQIWRTRNNGFATVGMGSQMSVCMPDKDMVFVVTADTQSVSEANSTILALLWNHLYPYVSDEPLPQNKIAHDMLTDKLNNLQFLPVDGNLKSAKVDNYNNIKYKLNANPMEISDIKFEFNEGKGCMIYTNQTGNHKIEFGFGDYIYGTFPETHYYGKQIGVPKGSGYRYKASAAWFDDSNLIIYLYIIDDYFGTLKINVSFKNKEISILMSKVAEWFLDSYNGFAAGSVE